MLKFKAYNVELLVKTYRVKICRFVGNVDADLQNTVKVAQTVDNQPLPQ